MNLKQMQDIYIYARFQIQQLNNAAIKISLSQSHGEIGTKFPQAQGYYRLFTQLYFI